jgi:hypothetical protein
MLYQVRGFHSVTSTKTVRSWAAPMIRPELARHCLDRRPHDHADHDGHGIQNSQAPDLWHVRHNVLGEDSYCQDIVRNVIATTK